MDDMNALERLVAREVVREMGPSRPFDPAVIFAVAVPDPSTKWRFQNMFSATKFAVVGVIVALFGGFLLSGALTLRPDNERTPAAAETAQAESPAASATPARSSEAVRLAGDGPVLAWEQVAGPPIDNPYQLLHGRSALRFVEDRFLLLDWQEGGSRVFESTDGRGWTERPASALDRGWAAGGWDDPFTYRFGDGYVSASGPGRALGFYTDDGTRLECEATEGADSPCRSPVPPGTIESLAVSPAGIVLIARISSKAAVDEIFGSDVAQGEWRWIPDWDKVTDSGEEIWALETEDGEIQEVVWGNYGFLPDTEDWVNVGWHSSDGVEWTRIPHLYGSRVLGTTQGFWLPDDRGPWFSRDGLLWDRVGWAGSEPSPWSVGGGLLVLDQAEVGRGRSARFLVVTPEGMAELPMSQPLARLKPGTWWDDPVTGPLGILVEDSDAEEILFSADGSSWSLSPFPDAWSLPDPADDSDFPPGAWAGTTFALGGDEIIAIRSKCPALEPTAELCGAMGAFAGTLPLETTVWRATVVEPTAEEG